MTSHDDTDNSPPMVRLNLLVPVGLLKAVKAKAKSEDESVSRVVRRAMRAYLNGELD